MVKDSFIQEKTGLLLQKSNTAVIVNLSIAFLTYLAIPSPQHLWLWGIITVSVVRLVFTFLVKDRSVLTRKVGTIYYLILSLVFLQGAAWGLASLLLFSAASELHRFYLIAILCGMSGGAVLTLAPSLTAFACYSLPALLPLVYTLLTASDSTYRHAGIMGAVFLVAVHILARRISLSSWELMRSRRNLERTGQELTRHKDRLEELVDQRTKELAESRENYRRLSEEINDAIYELDSNGKITYMSPAITAITGHEPQTLIGANFSAFIFPEDLPRIRQLFPKVLSGEIQPSEYRIVDVEGKPHWVRTSSRPIASVNGPVGLRGVLSDIENEKKAEEDKEQLLRRIYENQKLEAIGTLAGGLAHDFNNILMGIQGRASLLGVHLDASDPNLEHVQAIEQYVRSAAGLTGQVLGAARGGKYDPRPMDLNELVETSASLFSRTKKEISVRIHTAESPIIVEVDRQQIEQVLLNMYVNAGQAMPDGGELYVGTAVKSLEDDECRPYQAVPGPYAEVTLTDSGIGMEEETLQQIFDPFFTTKAKGRGTGLGLASAYGIITNHDGFITVKSEVGRGTTFRVYVPISAKAPQQEIIVDKTVEPGSETILLVDDEEVILEVGRAILEEMGYRVVVAASGQQAIDCLSREGEAIDLVLLDLIMPGMDGSKTFDLIRKLQPALPVILSSGYALNGQASAIMRRGCDGFLQKPFSAQELSQKIRSILNDN